LRSWPTTILRSWPAIEDKSDSSDDFGTVDLASVGKVDWDCLDDSRRSRRRHNHRIAPDVSQLNAPAPDQKRTNQVSIA